jgi:hypothetical protein
MRTCIIIMVALTSDKTPPPDGGRFTHERFGPSGTLTFRTKAGHQSQGPHAPQQSGIMYVSTCTSRRDRTTTYWVLCILACLPHFTDGPGGSMTPLYHHKKLGNQVKVGQHPGEVSTLGGSTSPQKDSLKTLWLSRGDRTEQSPSEDSIPWPGTHSS